MKRIFWKLVCCVLYLITAYFLAVQIAYFLSFHFDMTVLKSNGTMLCLDPSVLWWQGNSNYFRFVSALILIGLIAMILNIFRPSKKDKEIRNIRRRLSREEKLEYTHIASTHEAQKGLQRICRTLCEEKDSKQPFFWQQSQAMMEGLVCFLLEHEFVDDDGNLCVLDDNQINFQNINLLKNKGFQNITVKGRKVMTLEYYLTEFRKPTDKSYEKLIDIIREPEETRGSVMSTFDNHIALGIMNSKIEQMTSRSTFDFADFVDKKTAIFLIVHDEKKTYYPFVTIFVSQLYNEIVANARLYPKQRLPIPMDIIWDEFGISPAISDPDAMFSASRFRGIRWNIVIQDYSQLDKNYGKEVSKAIKNNIMNTVYLLGGDPQTLKEVSDKAGKKLQWNKEKEAFDTVPVISPDRLQHFSLSEALILRQRRMPILTRYYPYGSYIYHKQTGNKIHRTTESKLKKYDVFSISDDFAKLSSLYRVSMMKKNQNFKKVRIEDVYSGMGKASDLTEEKQGIVSGEKCPEALLNIGEFSGIDANEGE